MIFKSEEIPSSYTENYKTLHHDIGLVRRSNGLWDLWFGQDEISKDYKNENYLNIIEGDIVSATEIHSLQVGIIISCLTSWNYLNRTGNPVYKEFGNESYSLLKKNKGVNTKYKIKQFFIDCLNRMRRIYSVESLEVYETNNPYSYKVVFKVLSVTNTIVDGMFYLDTDSTKNTSILDINYNHPYTSVSNPLEIECVLRNEYGSIIEGEIIYIYIKNDNDSNFKFYGITEATNEDGCAYITIPPNGLNLNTEIMFIFRGNSLYNPCKSKIINIQTVSYYIKSRFTYKTVENENDKTETVIDRQFLYVEDSLGNSADKFRLGELLSDYVFLENINLSSDISIDSLENHYKFDDKQLVFDKYENEFDDEENGEYERYKLYLIPSNQFIEGTNRKYYKAYAWNDTGEKLVLTPYNVQLNSDNPNEVHFLIDDGDNGLFEIDFEDGHLYYQIDLIENEF